MTFKNIWSEEFLIVHCSFPYSLHFCSLLLLHPQSCLSCSQCRLNKCTYSTCTYKRTCLAIDLASSENTGAKESTRGEVCTIALWRALDTGPTLPPSLSLSLSFTTSYVHSLRGSAPLFPLAEYAFSGLEWRQGKQRESAVLSLRMWDINCGRCKRGHRTYRY